MKRSVFKNNKYRFGLYVAAGGSPPPTAGSSGGTVAPAPAPSPAEKPAAPVAQYSAAIEPIGVTDPSDEGDTVSIDERTELERSLAGDHYKKYTDPTETATSGALTIEKYAKDPSAIFDETKKQAWGVSAKQNPQTGQVTGYEVTGAAKGILDFNGTKFSIVKKKQDEFATKANEFITAKILEVEPGFADSAQWPESRQLLYIEALQQPRKDSSSSATVMGRNPLDQLSLLQNSARGSPILTDDPNSFITQHLTGSQRDSAAAQRALAEFQNLTPEGRWNLAYHVKANGMEAKDLLKLLDADSEGKRSLEAAEKELKAKDGSYQDGAEVWEGHQQRTKEFEDRAKPLREEMENREKMTAGLNRNNIINEQGQLTDAASALVNIQDANQGDRAYAVQDIIWDQIHTKNDGLATLEDQLTALKDKKDKTEADKTLIGKLKQNIKAKKDVIAGLMGQMGNLEVDGGWLDRHEKADKLLKEWDQYDADVAKAVFEAKPAQIKKLTGVKPVLTDTGKGVHGKNTIAAKVTDRVEDAKKPFTAVKGVFDDGKSIFDAIKNLTKDEDSKTGEVIDKINDAISKIRERFAKDKDTRGKMTENISKLIENSRKQASEAGTALREHVKEILGSRKDRAAARNAPSTFAPSTDEAQAEQTMANADKTQKEADLTEQRVDDFTTRRVGKRQYFV